MKILAFLVLLFGVYNLSYAGTIDPNTPDEKYVQYGEKFESVVKISCYDGKGTASGSAVIISPHWIVTAAHVVDDCDSWIIIFNNKSYQLKKVFVNPNYDSKIYGEYDIALGYSEEPIVLDHYPPLYKDDNEVGKVCSIAGCGITGNFITGANKTDNKKRAGSNFVDKIEKKVLVCSASRRHEKTTELEYLTCSGDSGGGLFIDGKLAGIHSTVMGYDGKPNSSYGDESCHSRISVYIEWITTTIEECEDKK